MVDAREQHTFSVSLLACLAGPLCYCTRMAQNTPTPDEVVAQLRIALSSALDNLPDVAGDPAFGSEATAACCADIAALSHLLAPEPGNGPANILAYL